VVITGWSWDRRADKWEDGFRHLKEFAEREGHIRVPDKYKMEDGFALSSWIYTQRLNEVNMDIARKARLEELPGWIWRVK
jgi:hypothetical protein